MLRNSLAIGVLVAGISMAALGSSRPRRSPANWPAWAIVVVVALHVAGALKLHVVDHDDVLERASSLIGEKAGRGQTVGMTSAAYSTSSATMFGERFVYQNEGTSRRTAELFVAMAAMSNFGRLSAKCQEYPGAVRRVNLRRAKQCLAS